MFNLYQHMNRHGEEKEQKEPQTTGHDRFYQERSRSSFRKKKKLQCRRAQSTCEINPSSINTCNKRDKFTIRSVSTDKEESEEEGCDKAPLVAQKIDSIAKLLFNKTFINTPSSSSKNSPVADSGSTSRMCEKTVEDAAATAICMEYLSYTPRYEYITNLCDIGSRRDRYWFAVTDTDIKTDRLLTLLPLGKKCPIEATERSRCLIMELFRALHHPYIYPILDVSFCADHVLAIIPFNARGSLKDLICKSNWNDEWNKKYSERGTGLPHWQVGRLGRQILEGLLFLKDKGFPPFYHLHSGNIMVQNGVARISGLENTLVGSTLNNKHVNTLSVNIETILLGYVLFEMCAGYELETPKPKPGHLQFDLDKYPQVVEMLELIFSDETPNLQELIICDIFRKIDLRELRGPCLTNLSQKLSGSCMSLLSAVHNSRGLHSEGCSPVTTPVHVKRRHYTDEDYPQEWHWSQ